MSLNMILLLTFCIITETAREVCFKASADNSSFIENLCKPIIWLGNFFWAVEMIGWFYVLKKLPLSIAFPIMSLSYLAIMFAGKFIFNEPLSKRHILGAILITAGVACIGMVGI